MKMTIIALFFLLPLTIKAQLPPQREVVLEGTVNFRDVGGYNTTDYRRIKMGRIYRAASLSKLTDKDMEELKRLKVYTVIDLRSEKEAVNAPDRLLPGADYLLLPAGSGNINDLAAFAQERASGVDVMTEFYSDIASFREKYRPLFRKLLSLPDTSAVVFHCSAGKDRTGIAAALLFYALDVPMETILSDYTASNIYRKEENEIVINQMVAQGIERYVAVQIMDANPQYLRATFNAIKNKYGSIDLFLYQELGIGEEAKLMLKEKYL